MRVQCCGAHYVTQPVLAEWAGIRALPHLTVSSSEMFEDTSKKICQERKQYRLCLCSSEISHTTLGKVCTSPSQFKSSTLVRATDTFVQKSWGFCPFHCKGKCSNDSDRCKTDICPTNCIVLLTGKDVHFRLYV